MRVVQRLARTCLFSAWERWRLHAAEERVQEARALKVIFVFLMGFVRVMMDKMHFRFVFPQVGIMVWVEAVTD